MDAMFHPITKWYNKTQTKLGVVILQLRYGHEMSNTEMNIAKRLNH